MHSAFLWCSCHHPELEGPLRGLIKPMVPHSIPEFFWMHLRRDIEQLARATGKSPDESAIIVHLVLQNILSTTPPICELMIIVHVSFCIILMFAADLVTTISSLNAKNAREQWEKEFNAHYIQPILNTLDTHLAVSMDLIANDDVQGDFRPICFAWAN